MTEKEWMTSVDPARMLGWLTGDPRERGGLVPPRPLLSDRKLRFRLVRVDAAWQVGTRAPVPLLAEAIYHERAFDRLPILADALEEAWCDSTDILNHCREPGEHVRGCWVVDLILGKS